MLCTYMEKCCKNTKNRFSEHLWQDKKIYSSENPATSVSFRQKYQNGNKFLTRQKRIIFIVRFFRSFKPVSRGDHLTISKKT